MLINMRKLHNKTEKVYMQINKKESYIRNEKIERRIKLKDRNKRKKGGSLKTVTF